MIETDCLRCGDRTDERVLEQTYIVLVDVHIGEDVLHVSGEHVARREHRLETVAALGVDGRLHRLGVLAVVLLRGSFIHHDGDDQFTRLRTNLGKGALLHIVVGERLLFVLVKMIEILFLDVAQSLVGNHPAHEVNGRVVLAAVFNLRLFHHHLVQHEILRIEFDGAVNLRLGTVHRNGHWLISQERHLKLVVIVEDRQDKVAVDVGRASFRSADILGGGKGDGFAIAGIDHLAIELRLQCNGTEEE